MEHKSNYIFVLRIRPVQGDCSLYGCVERHHPEGGGFPKRLSVFLILCQAHFVCKFLLCPICVVISELHIGRPAEFIAALGH